MYNESIDDIWSIFKENKLIQYISRVKLKIYGDQEMNLFEVMKMVIGFTVNDTTYKSLRIK